jgi:hypothetical protein
MSFGGRTALDPRPAPGSTPLAKNFYEGAVMPAEERTASVTSHARTASPTLRAAS